MKKNAIVAFVTDQGFARASAAGTGEP